MDIPEKGTNRWKKNLKILLGIREHFSSIENQNRWIKLNGQSLNINSKYRVVEPSEFPIGREDISSWLLITEHVFNLPLRKNKKKEVKRKSENDKP